MVIAGESRRRRRIGPDCQLCRVADFRMSRQSSGLRKCRPRLARGSMFKRLYQWTLSLAESPRATWALAIIAFAESSFFPLPPDLILVPMSLAKPKRAWFYAAICTIASVTGGVLGYAIGSAAVRFGRQMGDRPLRLPAQGRGAAVLLRHLRLADHPFEGPHPDPLQAGHHRQRLCRATISFCSSPCRY